jgi:hypothetical protein
MRRLLWPTLTATVAAVVVAGLGVTGVGLGIAGDGKTNKKTFEYAIGLWETSRTRRCRKSRACRTCSPT